MKPLRSSLFVPHGSPMFALNPGDAGASLMELGQRLTRPQAIVVVSPHWETDEPTVGTATHLQTIHDFGPFDDRLFDIQYPASGSPAAAQVVIQTLSHAGFNVRTDSTRGLDHGAWVPLRYLYPDASVPVVPLSLQPDRGPTHALRIGQALATLAQCGFLIVASGNVTHNLRDWQRVGMGLMPQPAYVQQFADWVHERMTAGDHEALLNYRAIEPNGRLAHPSDEHLLPLFTAIGAAGTNAHAHAWFCGISDHVIAMDGYAFE